MNSSGKKITFLLHCWQSTYKIGRSFKRANPVLVFITCNQLTTQLTRDTGYGAKKYHVIKVVYRFFLHTSKIAKHIFNLKLQLQRAIPKIEMMLAKMDCIFHSPMLCDTRGNSFCCFIWKKIFLCRYDF